MDWSAAVLMGGNVGPGGRVARSGAQSPRGGAVGRSADSRYLRRGIWSPRCGRLAVVLVTSALAIPVLTGPASAAALQSCGPVKMAGYPKALAIKVKVKGLSCTDASALWTSYVASGEALPGTLGDLKATCKDGSKGARKKAAKVNRLAIACRSSDGKVVTKAWVLGG